MTVQAFRMLLVEDDDDHATLTRLAIDRVTRAVELAHVTDGAAALAYLRGEPPFADRPRPQLVLLDLKLPGIDGHEVLAEAKRDPATRDVPIVVLSTSLAESDRARAYELHANGYLTKPLEHGRLIAMMEAVVCFWGEWNESGRP